MPSCDELTRARIAYEANEPRGLFYRTALELIRLADAGLTEINVAEALATHLMTWNASYYRFHGKFGEQHFQEIEALVARRHDDAIAYRSRRLEDLRDEEADAVKGLFADFEGVLGAVGAAKALHLLAPRFFPLWDTEIAARGYHVRLGAMGTNENRYWRFMLAIRAECLQLGGETKWGDGIVKRIDEFNYCRYSKRPPLL